MGSIFYPSLLLLITLMVAIGVLLKLRSELSTAASVRISDIGKNPQALSAEQLMLLARAQAGLPYQGVSTQSHS